MFVGTIVCGLLIRSCDGIACRFSFLRDVTMYALSVCVVWRTLESGSVSRSDVCLFFGMYLAYISIILGSDLYHRRVTLRRLKEEKRMRRRSFVEDARRFSRRLSRRLGRTLGRGSSGHGEDDVEGVTASPPSASMMAALGAKASVEESVVSQEGV